MNAYSKVILSAAALLLLAATRQVNAGAVTVQWSSACSSDIEFTLDLQRVPNLESLRVFTLNGLGVITDSSPLTFPAQGGAVYDVVAGLYRVSLSYSNSIGVSFAYGANLTPGILSGPGSVLITSDLGPASCGGTLTVVSP